ncbi:MAG: IS4 family transposase [Planctomycetota bacterium]
MCAKQTVPVDPKLDQEFDKAFEQIQELVDLSQADLLHPTRSNAVYTTSVVLWMLVYQRMNPDASLEAAVKKLLDSRPDLLPDNKRITNGTLSTRTGAYSRARSRTPCSATEWLAREVSQSLIKISPPSFRDRRVFVLDGTTTTLPPEEELQQRYPPASNQYGEGVWPVALLVVAHELASGAALIPEVGAMYGPQAVSETALIENCLAQMPADSIVMADSGFGIFSVAHKIHQAGMAFLLRMTKQRFDRLRKTATLIDEGVHWKTWSCEWQPSPSERKKHADLHDDVVLSVQLHEIELGEGNTLYLVTSLEETVEVLSDLYARRTDVEIDIRNIKVVLDTENIRARSVEMFHKELLTSMVAYNLVVQFRRQAADLVKLPPRRMSFKRTWTTFRQFLLSAMYTRADEWRKKYHRALGIAMQDKLPNRPGRKYPREAYKRRPKSTHFKNRKKDADPT